MNNILVGIEIKGTQEELNKLKEIKEAIAGIKREEKELSKTNKEISDERSLQLKEAKRLQSELEKQILARNRAEQADIKTLDGKRAQLTRLTQEYGKLEIGTKKYIETGKRMKEVRAEISAAEESTGLFTRNVGNYKNAVIDAFSQMGLNVRGFSETVSNVGAVFGGVTKATGGLSVAMRILRVALISTGIGALVAALGTLIAYFTGTQEGADKLLKIMIPIKAVFRELSEIVENVGGAFVKMFTSDLSEGWKDLKESVTGFGDKMKQAADDAQRLYDLTMQQRELSIAVLSQEANINNQIAQRVMILADENKSMAERKKAAEEAVQWQDVLNKLKIDAAKNEEEQFRIINKNDMDKFENQTKLIELANKETEIKTEGINAVKKITNQLYAIQFKQTEEQKKQSELEAERIKRLGDITITSDMVLKSTQMITGAVEELKASTREYDPLSGLTDEMLAMIAAGVELTKAKKSQYDQDTENLREALAAQQIDQDTHNSTMLKLNLDYSIDVVDQTAFMFNQLAEIAGKNSKFGKVLAVSSTLMNTYVSAMLAFKAGLELGGPLGLSLGIAQAAIATAFGLKQVQNIIKEKDTAKPKFAHGVIGLEGSGTETSDSIEAKLSKGESVMTARATRVFSPVLAAMEQAVGNRPNFGNGSRRFASGLIGQPVGILMPTPQEIIRQAISEVVSIPVFVSEHDITSTQQRVRMIKTIGDLG